MTSEAEQDGPDNSEQEEFQRRRVLVHPKLIEDHWEAESKPMHYFPHWRLLTLEFTRFEFIRSYEYYTTDDESFFDSIEEEEHFVRLGGKPGNAEEYQIKDNLSADEPPKEIKPWYERNHAERLELMREHLKDIKSVEDGQRIRLSGWADIEHQRSIDVISCDTPEKEDEHHYFKRIRRMKISVHESNERAGGVIMHWTSDLYRDEDDPSEDFLMAELYVPFGSLEKIENDLERQGAGARLLVNIHAYLFQHEMEASLAEPDMHQSYAIVYEKTATAIANSFGIRAKAEVRKEDEDDEWCYEEEEERVDPETVFRHQMIASLNNLGKPLTDIRTVMWVLAGGMIVSQFMK